MLAPSQSDLPSLKCFYIPSVSLATFHPSPSIFLNGGMEEWALLLGCYCRYHSSTDEAPTSMMYVHVRLGVLVLPNQHIRFPYLISLRVALKLA